MTYESNGASCCRGYIDGSIYKICSLCSVTIRMMIISIELEVLYVLNE